MQPIYIESGDEITTVIERLKAADDLAVALVVPRGAILLQSIVNLKLARKAATDQNKELYLITTDKIGRNLANQLGIAVYSKLDEKNIPQNTGEEAEFDDPEPHLVAGVKVHRYYEEEDKPAPTVEMTDSDSSTDEATSKPRIEPIVPKEILSPKKEVSRTGTDASEASRKSASESEPTEDITEAPIVIRPLEIQVPEDKTTFKRKEIKSGVVEIVLPAKKRALTNEAEKKPAKNPRRLRKMFIFLSYLVIIAILVGAGVGTFYLPKTSVVIHVHSTPWDKSLTTIAQTATKEISADGANIPAELVSVESTDKQDFAATGSADIGEKAVGNAKLFNRNGRVIAVPAGTILTASGVSFITNDLVNVPAATVNPDSTVADPIIPGQVAVNITAQNAGPDNNLSNTRGTVGVYVSDVYSMIITTTGGSSKKVSVITQTDIANARNALVKKLQTATQAKMNDQLKGRDLLSDSNTDQFAFSEFTVTVPAGTQVDKATVNGKGTLKRLIAERASVLNQAGSRALKAASTADSTNKLNSTEISKTTVDINAQTITVTTDSKGALMPIIPLSSIKSQLIGKNRQDGLSLIKLIVKDSDTTLSQTPDWWPNKNFPYSDKYLTVTVQDE